MCQITMSIHSANHYLFLVSLLAYEDIKTYFLRDETPIVTNLLQQVTKNQIIYFRSHHETQKFTSKFNHFLL